MQEDTIKLLKECDAGTKMAVSSIDEVFDTAQGEKIRAMLTKCKEEHEAIGNKIHELLNKYNDEEKDPNPVAKAMSWMKTNMKLMTNPSDQEVADLITDGCNMGTKSLHKYLNKYKAADEESRQLTKDLIQLEEDLIKDLRPYL